MSYVIMSMLSHEFPKIPSSFVLSYVMYTARAIPPSETSQDIPFISVYKELEVSKNINLHGELSATFSYSNLSFLVLRDDNFEL